MPSSVKDRFTNAYEPVFFLVKSRKYYFDLDAVRVPPKTFENRPYGIVREREFGYDTQYPQVRAKFNYRDNPITGGRIYKKQQPAGIIKPSSLNLYTSHKEFHELGKNPGDILSVEEVSDFPIFAVETHTIILGIEKFKNFSNFVSFIVNKLINSSFTMSARMDETNATRGSKNFRNFREELLSARPIQPNLISIRGNPYATITIKQSPNEISIEFGRNRWIFRSESFSNSDASLDKTNSQFFTINTKIINTPFLILMNWVSGLPLPFDVINQLNIFRSKSDGIRLSSFHNTTISQKQAQDISRMRSKFAKVFFVEGMLCSADVICSSISKKFMVMSTTKRATNSGLPTNFTNFPHIINISNFNDKVNAPGDLWAIVTCPAPKEVRGKHFATFPEKLIEPMIKAGCPGGGVVLDPFVGSGTTCVVAKKLGRNYIGIEINPEYCKIAEERLASIPEKLPWKQCELRS